MNTQDVMERAKRIFGDESAVQLTDADIFRWINDAQREIVMHNEGLLEKITTIDVVDGQDEYTFPADLLILRSIRYKNNDMVSYTNLGYMTLQEFDAFIDGWDGTLYGKGNPQVYTTYEDTIFVFPAPHQDVTAGLKILYSRKPVDVSDSLDPLDLPEAYHNAIVKYVLTKAYEMDEDYESSGMQFTQFQNDVSTLMNREKTKVQEYYPTITVLGEDAF